MLAQTGATASSRLLNFVRKIDRKEAAIGYTGANPAFLSTAFVLQCVQHWLMN